MNVNDVPVAVVFNSNWWFRNYGIAYEQPFYLDRETRVANDVVMRRALYERFGIGKPPFSPRPLIGSRHIAGGFVIPALFGIEVRFAENQAVWPVARNLSREEALSLRVPDVCGRWPMDVLLRDLDALEREFGYVTGDLDTDGVLNTSLLLRGNDLFLDMIEAPQVADHLFALVGETIVAVTERIRERTHTAAVATNRSVLHAEPSLYLHSNCSVQMVSPKLYRERLLPFEKRLAERLRPYGIHHCGNNLHLFAAAYAETGCTFVDVGWGSDVARSAAALPDAFLNLRLSPVRMLDCSAGEIRRDCESLLEQAGRRDNVGLCCINMDHGTPDANVLAMFETAERFGLSARTA
jgi:uroporphyrinogen-III decarboxylase